MNQISDIGRGAFGAGHGKDMAEALVRLSGFFPLLPFAFVWLAVRARGEGASN